MSRSLVDSWLRHAHREATKSNALLYPVERKSHCQDLALGRAMLRKAQLEGEYRHHGNTEALPGAAHRLSADRHAEIQEGVPIQGLMLLATM